MIKSINNMEYSQKLQRCGEYIEALQEERSKILVFQRELPLCLDLVTQAIEACKREISGTTTENVNGQSECSEQTTGECGGPVLEEFIPIRPPSSSHDDGGDDDDDGDEHESHHSNEKSDDNNTKSDWLKSAQLWNQPVPTPAEERPQEKEAVDEVKSNGDENRKIPATEGSGGCGGGGCQKNEPEKESGGKRKQRRCWSQYLHRRFLNALQQLGGAHVATPKQIREVMKVDGLTNDEVKSHLQKYRLHTRRPSQTVPNKGSQQAPHFVVVGGMWVPQTDYASAKSAVATSATAGIYGAAMPPQWPSHSNNFGPLISQDRSTCGREGEARCGSPVMSSSTRPNVKDGKKS
ncbi:PREDICTED: myb family transcription factor EFM-like [Tarenaya hassleriana]|uniref:myb family transcription factor EFM-like n=1 Tax=Tarenaya hassleriana TaxID=28532 RepID=UPI00053C5A61|nr:PREDICTED: myb family transcription factor EFM-like [Tarenaya hassleriana]